MINNTQNINGVIKPIPKKVMCNSPVSKIVGKSNIHDISNTNESTIN